MPPQNPGVCRRQLRVALRGYRDACGLTQQKAATSLDWSPSKLIRIESGAVTISVTDLRALLSTYGVSDSDRITQLVDLARSAREPSPYARFAPVASKQLLTYLEYELAASVIRNFEPVFVPGLLQTEAYTRAVLGVIRGDKTRPAIEQQVDLRAERQFRILRPEPERSTELHFLVDEGVIRRHVGGPETMREQVRHLIDQLDSGAVRLGVVPFDLGLYRSIRVPYVVFEFEGDEDDDVLYIENPEGEQLLRDIQMPAPGDTDTVGTVEPTVPATYLEIFLELEETTTTEQTRERLQSALLDLS
jgi:transcriptional regulator with XRE-family HTH domain